MYSFFYSLGFNKSSNVCAAASSASRSAWTYLFVVDNCVCPNREATVFIFVPLDNKIVADVWRSAWSLRWGILFFFKNFVNCLVGVCGFITEPSTCVNNQSSSAHLSPKFILYSDCSVLYCFNKSTRYAGIAISLTLFLFLVIYFALLFPLIYSCSVLLI